MTLPHDTFDVVELAAQLKRPLNDYTCSVSGPRRPPSGLWDLWVVSTAATPQEHVASYTTKALADRAEKLLDDAIYAMRRLLEP